jgi:PhnB protein
MSVQPYVFFDGRCEEALEFYSAKIGAQVKEKMRFSEAPPTPEMEGCGEMPPGSENNIMHASFQLGDSTVMVSDGMGGGQPKFEGFSLAYSLKSDEEAKRIFDALAEEGQIQMPLGPTFWTSSFGMVADKFGVSWMVMTEQ